MPNSSAGSMFSWEKSCCQIYVSLHKIPEQNELTFLYYKNTKAKKSLTLTLMKGMHVFD